MGENRESLALWRVMLPNLTVFLSNGAIMVLELVAGRVISRYLGMSLYTWTAIIGLILAGMSVGNYVGGWIADRFNPARALGPIFLLSAGATFVVLPLNTFAGDLSALSGFAWPTRIFLHVGLVFFGPAMVLGAITPLVAKMALGQGFGTGRAVGDVFAWGACGSILGTFFAGYYLVLTFGAREIVMMMAAVLGALGLMYSAAGFRSQGRAAHREERRAGSWAPFLKQLGPNATVFASNAAFMTLEMVASRIVSRHFGASLYTWTAVIGVVLAGVTIGNFAGGRMADRFPSRRVLAYQFIVGSALMITSGVVSTLLHLYWRYSYTLLVLPWPTQISAFVLMAFFLPCVVLGMVSPMVIKLTLTDDRSGGRVVGAIYAWGTIGSIVGTFAAGYFLIDRVGTVPLLGLTALALALTSLAYLPKSRLAQGWALVSLAGAAGLFYLPTYNTNALYVDESNYTYIAITADEGTPNLRTLTLDNLVHSEANLDDPTQLIYRYEWVYRAVIDRYFPAPDPIKAMIIGGGGFTFPHYLEVTRPGSAIEVSEIDPAVIEAAHAAFGFPRETSIEVYNMDARNRVTDVVRMLERDPGLPKFDLIFGDSINDFSVPYHLTTVEFVEMVRGLLTNDGLYLLNMIDQFSSGRFLGAAIATCRQVFDHVYVFNTSGGNETRDTFVLVCASRPLSLGDIPNALREEFPYSGELFREDELDQLLQRTDSRTLTDNYAPVENFLAPVVRKRYGEGWEIRQVLARNFMSAGKPMRAIRHARLGLEAQPEWVEMETLLTGLLFDVGRADEALDVGHGMLPHHPDPNAARLQLAKRLVQLARFDDARAELEAVLQRDARNVLGHFMLGVEEMRANRAREAQLHFEAVLEVQARHLDALYNLGLAHASQARLGSAVDAWKRALEVDPEDWPSAYNLVYAYTLMRRYDEAWDAVRAFRERGVTLDAGLIANLEEVSGRTE